MVSLTQQNHMVILCVSGRYPAANLHRKDSNMIAATTIINGYHVQIEKGGPDCYGAFISRGSYRASFEVACEWGLLEGHSGHEVMPIHTATLLDIRDWLQGHYYPTNWSPDKPGSA